jgi:hypothetical protein
MRLNSTAKVGFRLKIVPLGVPKKALKPYICQYHLSV